MNIGFDPDPRAIRLRLETLRAQGVPFDEAWKRSKGPSADSADERRLVGFMRKHFEAAYNGDASPSGRCLIPERDTSDAVPVADFMSGVDAKRTAMLPKARTDAERCKSGDGCDRLATRGRFGKAWCAHHATELERLTESFDLTKFNGRQAKAAA